MGMSTAPEAIDRIVAAIPADTSDPADERYAVIDSWPADDETESQILIAYAGDPDDAAVRVVREDGDLKRRSREESYEIECQAYAFSGGDDLKTVRDKAFWMVDIVERAMKSDPTLDGLVMAAHVESLSYAAGMVGQGAVCVVTFMIQIVAMTRG